MPGVVQNAPAHGTHKRRCSPKKALSFWHLATCGGRLSPSMPCARTPFVPPSVIRARDARSHNPQHAITDVASHAASSAIDHITAKQPHKQVQQCLRRPLPPPFARWHAFGGLFPRELRMERGHLTPYHLSKLLLRDVGLLKLEREVLLLLRQLAVLVQRLHVFRIERVDHRAPLRWIEDQHLIEQIQRLRRRVGKDLGPLLAWFDREGAQKLDCLLIGDACKIGLARCA
mmetsp:Transcript_3492/g.7538  ORF Transcript_3492/g.7538 Transcript_3492/m.7538 type:complete len:230 (-) Transcript_3492:797-1486(-)